MTLRYFSNVLALAICFLIVACSSSSAGEVTEPNDHGSAVNTDTDFRAEVRSNTQHSRPSSEKTNGNVLGAIAGLWNISASAGGTTDLYYLEIFANGIIIEWDYLGDEFDKGENCFDRLQSIGKKLGENSYSFNGKTATITATGKTLTVTDAEGTLVFPAMTEFTSAEYNECN